MSVPFRRGDVGAVHPLISCRVEQVQGAGGCVMRVDFDAILSIVSWQLP